MSIKPVDFQVMIPRTLEAAKVSHDEIQKNLANQQQQTSATQHKAENSLKQVNARAQADHVYITEKQKENRKNSKKDKKEGNKSIEMKGNDHSKLKHEMANSTIDIKI